MRYNSVAMLLQCVHVRHVRLLSRRVQLYTIFLYHIQLNIQLDIYGLMYSLLAGNLLEVNVGLVGEGLGWRDSLGREKGGGRLLLYIYIITIFFYLVEGLVGEGKGRR